MAPPLHVFSTRFARRMFLDRAARWVVTLGGVIIIGTILAILLVIVGEVYPLLRPATAHPRAPVNTSLDGRALAIETDEYRATAAVVTQTGVHFVSLTGARAAIEARGEIFTVPAEKGDIRNLTQTTGATETGSSEVQCANEWKSAAVVVTGVV